MKQARKIIVAAIASVAVAGCMAGSPEGGEAALVDSRPLDSLREEIVRGAAELAEDPAAARLTMWTVAAQLSSLEAQVAAAEQEGLIDRADVSAFEGKAALVWEELAILEDEIVSATGETEELQLHQAQGTVTIGTGGCNCWCQCEVERTRCLVRAMFGQANIDDCDREMAICQVRCIITTVFGGTIRQ